MSVFTRQWQLLIAISVAAEGQAIAVLNRQSGVSTKTVRRDLDLLCQIGFPLEETSTECSKNCGGWKPNPASQVGKRLGISVGAVRMCFSLLQSRLQQEMRTLA